MFLALALTLAQATDCVEQAHLQNLGVSGARLESRHVPLVGGPFELELEGGAPGAHGCVFIGTALAPAFFGDYAATIYAAPPYLFEAFDLDEAGTTSGILTLPVVPEVLCGQTFVIQGFYLDGSAPNGVAFTTGIALTFGAPAAAGSNPAAPTLKTSAQLTAEAAVTIFGFGTFPGSTIRIEAGDEVVEATVDPLLGFSASLLLASNSKNLISAKEIDVSGLQSPPAFIEVIQDNTAPELFVDLPVPGSILTSPTATVAGRVSDILGGFEGLEVEVNGLPAVVDIGIGTNGTYETDSIPLAEGAPTAISVTARDALGNAVTKTISVSYKVPTSNSLEITGGADQAGPISEELPLPIIAQLRGDDGLALPLAGKLITFSVAKSDGALGAAPGATNVRKLAVETGSDGTANVYWRLGTDAGCGNNVLRVESGGFGEAVLVTASALPGAPTQINVGTAGLQVCPAGAPAPAPLRVWVSDGCNGVAGVPVTFRVTQGDGLVAGLPEVVVPTSATGHAEVPYHSSAGLEVVEADFAGNAGLPATFVMQSLVSVPGQPASLQGLVLDNGGVPIEGARCELVVGELVLEVTTGPNGTFEFPVIEDQGAASLLVDASEAGPFPHLRFRLSIVEGAENHVPAPVRIPRLDPLNDRAYSLSKNTVLEVEGIEGFRVIVTPGSMTIDGEPAPEGTTLSLNQVHFDDIPMPMPDGASPLLAWTLQPGGAHFDPPARIEYPNVAALAPGAASAFLSFDHATERFEIVATGQVTEDGSSIVSNPGDGISIAGWGGNCPPYSATGTAKGSKCKVRIYEDFPELAKDQATCLGEEREFLAVGAPALGEYQWFLSGGAEAIGSTEESTIRVRLNSAGEARIRVLYTCPDTEEASGGSDIEEVLLDVVEEDIVLASLETGWKFQLPFEDVAGASISPPNRFRFLVGGKTPGENRTFKVRYCAESAGSFLCRVTPLDGYAGGDLEALEAVLDEDGTAEFELPFTDRPNPLTSPNGIPPTTFEVEVFAWDGSGPVGPPVVGPTLVAQDLIDRMRQEYLDMRSLTSTQVPTIAKFLDAVDAVTSNGVPPRGASGVPKPKDHFTSKELAGPVGGGPEPNYVNPEDGNGIAWDSGFAFHAQQVRVQTEQSFKFLTPPGLGSSSIGLKITSGHRSPSHNKEAGGVINSNHQWGRAVDLKPVFSQGLKAWVALYRTAIAVAGVQGETLLENVSLSPQVRLPQNWLPPTPLFGGKVELDIPGTEFKVYLVDSTFSSTGGLTGFGDPGDTIPERVEQFPFDPPPMQATEIPWGGHTIVLTDAQGNAVEGQVATHWRLRWTNAAGMTLTVDVEEELKSASHVHTALQSPSGSALNTLGAAEGEDPGSRAKSGPELDLDGTWTVTAGGQTYPVAADGSFTIPNITRADLFGPEGPGTPADFLSDFPTAIVAQRSFEGLTEYAASDLFQIFQGNTISIENLTSIDVAPNFPESVELSISDDTLSPGDPATLSALGTLADGTMVELMGSPWTTLLTANPDVVQVNQDGTVEGIGSGKALIAAVHNGATGTLEVSSSLIVDVVVQGFVYDESGNAVSGAQVSAFGLGNEVMTDSEGRFVLPAQEVTAGSPISLQVRGFVDGTVIAGGQLVQIGLKDKLIDGGLITVHPLTGGYAFPMPALDVTARSEWGDINGDEVVDIVTPGASADSLSVLLNDGDGVFFSVGSIPFAGTNSDLTLGDLDGDGDPDLVAVGTNALTTFVNDGGGGFSEVDSISGSFQGSVIADLDSDGIADVVAVGIGFLETFAGQGGGVLTPSISVALPGNNYRIPLAPDIDGDGDRDLIVAGLSGSGTVAALTNQGGGTFAPAMVYSAAGSLNDLELGDLDLDGDLDIAVAGTEPRVLWNDGHGCFDSILQVDGSPYSLTITLADVDADADLDIVTDLSQVFVGVLEPALLTTPNLGQGQFGPAESSAMPFANYPTAIPLADVDNDGDEDFVLLGPQEATLALRSSDSEFQTSPKFVAGEFPGAIAAGDLNNDGAPDYVLSDWFPSPSLVPLLNQGDGSLVAQAAVPIDVFAIAGGLHLGDANGDGALDLFVGDSNEVQLALGDGTGGFMRAQTVVIPNFSIQGAVVGDFNGDGAVDVATSSSIGLEVHVNQGFGSFSPPTVVSIGSDFLRYISLGDFDGDGDLDVAGRAQAFGGGTRIYFFENQGSADFVAIPGATLSGVSQLTAAELTQDGALDLVAIIGVSTSEWQILPLVNDGQGNFAAGTPYPLSFQPFSLAALDYDGDGRNDLALLTDNSGSRLELLRGVGLGEFVGDSMHRVEGSARQVVATDHDGDGAPDLALVFEGLYLPPTGGVQIVPNILDR